MSLGSEASGGIGGWLVPDRKLFFHRKKSSLLSAREWAINCGGVKICLAILVMAVTALAGSSDPGATAVHFLEMVRTKKLNLEPGGDTALSPQTSEQKRKEIARRLERLARDLGTDPLEVGAMKLDDDLAAVLVRKIGGFDPGRLQVIAVAMVKRGADWAVAPVPASFENSGVGYAAVLRQRLASLEDWMLREQAIDLQKLRDQSADRMRRKISESLPLETLRNLTSKQAAERFLAACDRRDLPEIFGLLGGLASPLPNDWSLRLRAAETAVAAAAEGRHPWRLLIAAEVLRVLVHHEEDGDSATISIGCLDPAGNPPRVLVPRIELVHLDLSKSSDGLWRIDPPESFLQEETTPEEAVDDAPDPELLEAFPAKLAALYPPVAQPTAEQARQVLLDTLRTGSPGALFAHIRLDRNELAARNSCVRAAGIWWTLREPSNVGCALPLAWQEDEHHAAAACQFFSARNPDRLDLMVLYFDKSAGGWFWTPDPGPETEKSFHEWSEVQTKRWQDEWQNAILKECPVLGKIPDSGAPADDESRQLVEAWFKATRAGDVMAALRLTARLDLADSPAALLRNLGYEMTGTRHNPNPPTIAGIHRGGILTAVGTRSATEGAPSFPLYPVIATPKGPRILLEIDLFAAGSRSRDFLNKTALARLRKASADATDDLASLYAEHQTKVATPAKP